MTRVQLIRIALGLSLAPIVFGQSSQIPGGGGICTVTNSASSGLVLTASATSGQCTWTSAPAGTVDANAIKNGGYIADTSITANSITGTTTTTFPAAYAAGQNVWVKVANTNTGATTININSLGAVNVTKFGSTALVSGDLTSGHIYHLFYDGTQFQVIEPNLLVGNLTGVLLPAQGGTGSNVTVGAAGHVLRSNASAYVDSAIQTADVPTGTSGGVIPLLNGNNTYSGSATFTGAVNAGGATSTAPAVVAAAATITASSCTTGAVAFANNATAGQNLYFCTATNTWTQQLNSGSQSLVSLGFTATAPTFNAAGTTTCAFAAASGFTCEPGAATGNTTLSATGLTSCVASTACVTYTLVWTQDATTTQRTITYPGTFINFCQPINVANAQTTITFHVDGSGNAQENSCISNVSGTFFTGPELSAITSTVSGNGTLSFDSSTHTGVYYANNSANKHIIPRTSGSTDQLACGDLSNSVASCSTDATVATNISSGTLGIGRFPVTPDVKIIPFANCVSGTAGAGVSYASFNFTATCRAGSNNLGAALQAIPSTGASLQFMIELPADWATGTQPYINIQYGSGSNSSGTVIWTVSSACVDVSTNGGASDDPTFHAETAFSTQTMAASNRMWYQTGQFTAMTSGNGCKAFSPVIVKAALSGTAGSNINVYQAVITVPRQMVVQAN